MIGTDELVSCTWLAEHLSEPGLVLLDATFFLPNQGRDAERDYLAEHLPGARFFDIDAVADQASALPHMLPPADFFAQAAVRLGIDNASHVVVYDHNNYMASARAWWMFRIFGHDRVSVLDGGLDRWKSLHQPLSEGPQESTPSRGFVARFRPELLRNLEQIRDLLSDPRAQLVDARSPGRFAGTEPEPRAGIRSGHIPGSKNIPYRQLIDETSGLMKPPEDIEAVFRGAELDLERPIVTTCGTGVTAAILALGLYRTGRQDTPVYDGSWTEWGGRGDTPVAAGA